MHSQSPVSSITDVTEFQINHRENLQHWKGVKEMMICLEKTPMDNM